MDVVRRTYLYGSLKNEICMKISERLNLPNASNDLHENYPIKLKKLII